MRRSTADGWGHTGFGAPETHLTPGSVNKDVHRRTTRAPKLDQAGVATASPRDSRLATDDRGRAADRFRGLANGSGRCRGRYAWCECGEGHGACGLKVWLRIRVSSFGFTRRVAPVTRWCFYGRMDRKFRKVSSTKVKRYLRKNLEFHAYVISQDEHDRWTVLADESPAHAKFWWSKQLGNKRG